MTRDRYIEALKARGFREQTEQKFANIVVLTDGSTTTKVFTRYAWNFDMMGNLFCVKDFDVQA